MNSARLPAGVLTHNKEPRCCSSRSCPQGWVPTAEQSSWVNISANWLLKAGKKAICTCKGSHHPGNGLLLQEWAYTPWEPASASPRDSALGSSLSCPLIFGGRKVTLPLNGKCPASGKSTQINSSKRGQKLQELQELQEVWPLLSMRCVAPVHRQH